MSKIQIEVLTFPEYDDVKKELNCSFCFYQQFIGSWIKKLKQTYLPYHTLNYVAGKGYVVIQKNFPYRNEIDNLARSFEIVIPNEEEVLNEIHKMLEQCKERQTHFRKSIQNYKQAFKEYLKTKEAKRILINEYVNTLDFGKLNEEDFEILSQLALKNYNKGNLI